MRRAIKDERESSRDREKIEIEAIKTDIRQIFSISIVECERVNRAHQNRTEKQQQQKKHNIT